LIKKKKISRKKNKTNKPNCNISVPQKKISTGGGASGADKQKGTTTTRRHCRMGAKNQTSLTGNRSPQQVGGMLTY